MAKRDVEEYYLQICKDYKEMRQLINDIESIEDPVVAENARKNLASIKTQASKIEENYMRWSQIIWLLNKPVRKEKAIDQSRRESKVREGLKVVASPEFTLIED